MYNYYKFIPEIVKIVNDNKSFSLTDDNIEKVLSSLSNAADLETEYPGNVEMWAGFLLLGYRLGQINSLNEISNKVPLIKENIIKTGMKDLAVCLKTEFPDLNVEYSD